MRIFQWLLEKFTVQSTGPKYYELIKRHKLLEKLDNVFKANKPVITAQFQNIKYQFEQAISTFNWELEVFRHKDGLYDNYQHQIVLVSNLEPVLFRIKNVISNIGELTKIVPGLTQDNVCYSFPEADELSDFEYIRFYKNITKTLEEWLVSISEQRYRSRLCLFDRELSELKDELSRLSNIVEDIEKAFKNSSKSTITNIHFSALIELDEANNELEQRKINLQKEINFIFISNEDKIKLQDQIDTWVKFYKNHLVVFKHLRYKMLEVTTWTNDADNELKTSLKTSSKKPRFNSITKTHKLPKKKLK